MLLSRVFYFLVSLRELLILLVLLSRESLGAGWFVCSFDPLLCCRCRWVFIFLFCVYIFVFIATISQWQFVSNLSAVLLGYCYWIYTCILCLAKMWLGTNGNSLNVICFVIEVVEDVEEKYHYDNNSRQQQQ